MKKKKKKKKYGVWRNSLSEVFLKSNDVRNANNVRYPDATKGGVVT